MELYWAGNTMACSNFIIIMGYQFENLIVDSVIIATV
jgi:hypothetical protein